MKLFNAYLRQNRRVIYAYLLFCAVFALSFYLYGLSLSAVAYPAALCAFFGACFIARGFVLTKKRHKQLLMLMDKTSALIDALPGTDSIGEGDCYEIIRTLRKTAADSSLEFSQRFDSTVEYYTLWAHQIKTPIASMRLALQNEDTPLARKLMGELLRIEQYVEMVLTYLRLDSDETDFVFREQELDGIIRRSVRRFSSEFIARRLRLEFSETGISIVTDEKWLGFVLEQLISNALKYTPSGCIRIYLSDDRVLCIEDTGIGIAPEDLPRIFEKGYTGANGRADLHASGIGLNLCRRVCEHLGIGISARSAVGKGTTVMLDLKQHIITE